MAESKGPPGNDNDNEHEMKMKLIAGEILGWNWKLTAADLFSADFRLLPAVAGTVMTYIMFMYQLKISEFTSQWGTGASGTSGSLNKTTMPTPKPN